MDRMISTVGEIENLNDMNATETLYSTSDANDVRCISWPPLFCQQSVVLVLCGVGTNDEAIQDKQILQSRYVRAAFC